MKLLGISVLTLLPSAKACSRVFQNKWDMKVSGRSMDWDHSFDDVLFINPRGMKMDGGSTENPVEWESKYGSVTASVIGYFAPQPECASLDFYLDGSTDGVNEKGLAAHVLYLGEEDGTVYGTPTPEKKNIHYFRWVRYVLDNYATVEEAIEGLSSVVTTNANICPGYTEDGEGKELGAHMAIEDASGDSAVFEHVGGVLQVYHNKNDTLVMTNEPPFDQHRIILADYEPWGGNITLPDNLPGSVASEDRFIRLEYYLKYTPEPKTEVEGVANIMSLISATNVPFGAPYGGGVYPTWWESVIDVKSPVYYFNWLETPNVIWVELAQVDFDTLDEYLYLRPQDMSLVADVTCDFVNDDGAKYCSGADEESAANDRAIAVASTLLLVIASTMMM